MKKLALLTVVVTLGLLKWNTNSYAFEGDWGGGWGDESFGPVTPHGLTSVDIDLVAIEQGNINVNTNTGTTTAHFKQSDINNNDILALINSEFGTTFSRTNGDHLAISNFWEGKFMVLNSTGAVVLANASVGSGDHYLLELTSTNTVFAGSQTTNSETKYSVTEGSLKYESGNGSNSFQLTGFTTVNDSYFHGFSNSVESFELTGGIGSISSTNGPGVLTGSVSGSGKDNAPTQ